MSSFARGFVWVSVIFLLGACALLPHKKDVPLENLYWRLTELDGKAVPPVERQRQPHIILQGGKQPSLVGSGGCNRLMGGYTLKGDTIAFGNVAGTRRFCMKGMETETAFLKVLDGDKHWSVHNGVLTLQDDKDNVVARFAADDLR